MWGTDGRGFITDFQPRGEIRDDLISRFDLGTWVRYGYHTRLADSVAASNGILSLWKNGELWGRWGPEPIAGNAGPDPLKVVEMMGWHNAGFTNDTRVWIDDIKIYSTDPGW